RKQAPADVRSLGVTTSSIGEGGALERDLHLARVAIVGFLKFLKCRGGGIEVLAGSRLSRRVTLPDSLDLDPSKAESGVADTKSIPVESLLSANEGVVGVVIQTSI